MDFERISDDNIAYNRLMKTSKSKFYGEGAVAGDRNAEATAQAIISNESGGNGGSGFLKSAALLTLGGIAAKVLGAVYRIPLTNMLGAYGIGVYQLAFPLYALLVTLSAAGIPTAVAKLVAEKLASGDEAGARASFKCALFTLTAAGFIFGGALFLLAEPLGGMQSSSELSVAYRVIAAAIPAECISAAFKGWFHGKMNMKPTVVSQIVEQVVKMAAGLIAVSVCLPDVLKAVYAAVAAVTASEVAGLVVMAAIYLKNDRLVAKNGEKAVVVDFKATLKELLCSALPLTLSSIVLPVAHLIDSVMVRSLINLDNATELYGLWSGPVHSLITMPSVLIMGIAAAVVPGMAGACASRDRQDVSEKFNASLSLAFALSLPAAFGLAFLPKEVCGLLYPDFSAQNVDVFARLLTFGSGSIIFMAVLMTSNSVLQANGRLYIPVIALTLGSAVKCIMDLLLYGNPAVNIYEESISHCACNLVACSVNMWYIKHKLGLKTDWTDVLLRPLAATSVMTVFIMTVKTFFTELTSDFIGKLLIIAAAGLVYCLTLGILWKDKIIGFLAERKGLKKDRP